MARLISVYRLLAASSSLLNYWTWYHHAIHFKKITKASHKPDYPYEMKKKKTRKLQFSTNLWKISELPSLLAQMKKQNPSNYSPVKKNSRLASLSFRNSFQRGVYVWLSSFKMYHNASHGFCEFFCMKTLSFAHESNIILEKKIRKLRLRLWKAVELIGDETKRW